jgi:hypothetical protein
VSSIRFVWNNGVSFGWLSKALFDYFTAAGLAFPRLSMPGTADSGKFRVRRFNFPVPQPQPIPVSNSWMRPGKMTPGQSRKLAK